MSTKHISTSEKLRIDESDFPAVKHRPAKVAVPSQPRTLTSVRAALQKNPETNVPDDLAGVVTAGVTDPARFKMLVETHTGPNGDPDSLLIRKRVSDGVVYTTQQHDRYIDMGVLPDVAGARWAHTLHNQLDVDVTQLPEAMLTTADDAAGPRAMLNLVVEDHDELAARVREAFIKTSPDGSTAGNDYTDSILQSGVKEPLLLMGLRVQFQDGSDDEFYLAAIDGNSRYVSMWKGRTGGNADAAATACIETVIGTKTGSTWRRVTQRKTRDRIATQAILVNKGLEESTLTEATIRSGQTLVAPAVVVVGASATTGGPLLDLPAAREDLIATIHTDATPWDQTAQAEQGMSRLLRRAEAKGMVTADQRRVIEGRCTPTEMNALLGLPPHRLWATALTLMVVLNPWYDGMGALFREEFNVKQPRRATVGRAIASTALSGYRSSETLGLAVNAFSDGGPITQMLWDYRWTLTTGDKPVAVLDKLLKQAISGTGATRQNAIMELSVLGGSAAMLSGLITRDRGSKESTDGKRAVSKVPFRARPNIVVEQLAKSTGGLKVLHSMAVAHVTSGQAKQFHTSTEPGGAFADGDPVIDAAGAQASLEMEWDVVLASDPARAAVSIAAASTSGNGGAGSKDESVRAREDLQRGTELVVKATKKLISLKKTLGSDVFGSYTSIEAIKERLQSTRDDLAKHGPAEPVIITDEDDDEDDE